MLFVMSTMSRQSRLKTQYLLYDSNTNVNSMINRRVSLFYRYPLKAFHHMVCPCTLYGVCVVCPGTIELVGQHCCVRKEKGFGNKGMEYFPLSLTQWLTFRFVEYVIYCRCTDSSLSSELGWEHYQTEIAKSFRGFVNVPQASFTVRRIRNQESLPNLREKIERRPKRI